MMQQDKPSTRDAILDAAEAVVGRDGGARLTIDAVVVESGFSKGGVLYHFPNKTALLQAMVQRMIEKIAAEVGAAREAAQAAGTPEHVAVVEAVLAHRKTDSGISMALLAASAEQPALLDPARNYVCDTVGEMARNAPDPALSAIIFLAIDGLHFTELLGINYLSPEQRDAVQARLIQMTQEMSS